MSTEGDAAQVQPVAGDAMDINTALQEVMKSSLIHDGLARGISESVKALDSRNAELCILSNSIDEVTYTKVIEGLCAEHGIKLIKVDDSKKLGEMAGLCKIDKEGKARKVNGCGVVVIKQYGSRSQAWDVLQEHLGTVSE